MITAIIMLLIYLCLLALLVWLVVWVLGEIGLTLPPQVIRIIWVIAALVALLLILNTLTGTLHLPAIGATK